MHHWSISHVELTSHSSVIGVTDVEKTKNIIFYYYHFVSWNTLSHLNIIGLTHSRHTQVIVEVTTLPLLCGYLTDVNSGGIVRQPVYHSLLPLNLSRHALYKAQTHTSSPSNPPCTLTHCPPPLPPPSPSPSSTVALRIIAQCRCEGVMDLMINMWAYMGVERENSQNC